MKMRNQADRDEMAVYFEGRKLYGDDFSDAQIQAWYEKEKEGYADLVRNRPHDYQYGYHALNMRHGFRHITVPKGAKALAIGGAFCEELLPVVESLDHITNLDPSRYFDVDEIKGVPIEHVQPTVDGRIPFKDNEFDLITCFGVLHHIPNVSFVIRECFRCLKPGGHMLVREPVVSMGDWRQPRRGLTANERGIPSEIFTEIVRQAGFHIAYQSPCDFSPLVTLVNRLGGHMFTSKSLTLLDQLLSHLFRFNLRYHRKGLVDRFAPASLAMVLEKH